MADNSQASPGNPMKIGVVTATDPAAVKCRVQFDDHDGMESYWLPVLHHKTHQDKSYWLPDVGEHVCVLMDDNAEFGVIIGAIYSEADAPPVISLDKHHTRYQDGTWIEYDRATHQLTVHCTGDILVVSETRIILQAPRIDLNPGGA